MGQGADTGRYLPDSVRAESHNSASPFRRCHSAPRIRCLIDRRVRAAILRPHLVHWRSIMAWRQEQAMRYRVLIQQDEDGMYVAEVPSLPGCISQGKTREEAVIERARSHGRISRESGRARRSDLAADYGGDRGVVVSQVPVVSGRLVVRALERIGYVRDRQRGSHIVLRQAAAPYRRIVVPDHAEVARGPSGRSFARPV